MCCMTVTALVCIAAVRDDLDFSSGDPIVLENADWLNYNRNSGDFEAVGHVVIGRGEERLSADRVRGNLKAGDVVATGEVKLTRQGNVWSGTDLRYNFRTKEGDVLGLAGGIEPFRLNSDRTERINENEYRVYNAEFTTCTNAACLRHYHIKAGEAVVVPGDHVKARGGVVYLGCIPVMYIPYWYRDLAGNFGLRVYPGYNSRMGPFVLSSYRYRMGPLLKAETHVDFRSKRGLAFGQDFKWRDGFTYYGDVSTYYMNDKEPIDDDEDVETSDIDNERYRVLLRHRYNAGERDYVLMQANYLSDTDVLEDFFEDEYRDGGQPENHIVYTHRGESFSFSGLFNTRLNDFYESVNRTPEVAFDFMRQKIGDGELYYEGRTVAAVLARVWPADSSGVDDYSVFRVDSSHMMYRPSKYFGFLNFIPRAGWRGTYYSETVASDGLEFYDNGAATRSMLEFGAEVSYKAFKVIREGESPRRHVVEPYADYTISSEPSLLPDEIYQFDEVDTLDKEHVLSFGVRNKLQAKRNGLPFDLVDVDVSTAVLMDRETGVDTFDELRVDAELRPFNYLAFDLDSMFDINNFNLNELNARVVVSGGKRWKMDLEHRFLDGESSLFTGDVTYFPSEKWAYNIYGRYEADEGRLEEEGWYVQRNLDCMSVRTGINVMPGYTRADGSERDGEWRVILEIWLTAFPHSRVLGRHRN